MEILPISLLVIPLIVHIILMIVCLKEISTPINFNYFNRTIWIFIVVFGSVLGQLTYLFLEGNEKINNGGERIASIIMD